MSAFRPRLIAIDTLGSMRSPRMEIPIAPRSVTVAWDGDIQTIRQDDGNSQLQINGHSLEIEGAKDEIGEYVSKPRFWTDCLLPTVKRRWSGEDMVIILREYLDSSFPGGVFASPSCSSNSSISASRDNDSTSLFSSFAQGLDLYRAGGDAFDDFEDHFHRLVEECDHPTGFSLLIDSDSAFAGVGLRLGEFLGEEFAKLPVFSSAISYFQPPQPSRRWSTVCLNRLALFTAMEEATNWPSHSAWMPVTEAGDVCAASSRLAAGLATLLTPVLLNRDHEYSSEMHGFINSLTPTHKKMMSLSLTTQDTTTKLQEEPIWTHANTFSMRQSTTDVSSRPHSLVCKLFARGLVIEEDSFLSYLPRSRGYACFLEEGVDPELSCSLPSVSLTVPRLNRTEILFCTQPARSRACALIEGVSHWTAENQWLARGLKLHMDYAFCKPVTSCVEADELRQLHESAMSRLVEAYASPDG
ncbi:hypothetical protein TcWFU_003504 [Taenia crassiceps]|uniref:DML1/Misato tubulin domain-containing protein n=1 Tax=Taenia crassiceps TaxID=6207 RepID=A0ABR4QPY7_9CEST